MKSNADSDIAAVVSDRSIRWHVTVASITALVFVPVLYYVNGPAVSPEQLAVRWFVVLCAIVCLIGAILIGRPQRRAVASKDGNIKDKVFSRGQSDD